MVMVWYDSWLKQKWNSPWNTPKRLD